MNSSKQVDSPAGSSKSGRCVVCGETWVNVSRNQYHLEVSQHIIEDHRDAPMDTVIVEPFELLGGESDEVV